MKKILILSTQRSGSTMVCDDIAGTGKLGKPSEYFINVINSHQDKNSEQLKEDVLEALAKGISGESMSIKLMSNQIGVIGAILRKSGLSSQVDNQESFNEYFKDWFFVRVIRNDKVAQAVSRVMAAQSQVYHTVDSSNGLEGMLGHVGFSRNEELVHYDFDAIQKEVENIQREEMLLDVFIEKFAIDVFSVVYESAVDNREYVQQLSNKLDIGKIELSERRLKKVSLNAEEWIKRFLSN